MIDTDARVLFIDPVDNAIPPDAIGAVTVEFTGQLCSHLRFFQQSIHRCSNEPFDFRR
jgi:hypothetical protein